MNEAIYKYKSELKRRPDCHPGTHMIEGATQSPLFSGCTWFICSTVDE